MITLGEAAEATGGEWLSNPLPPETPLRGASHDTRALGTAEIFITLRGAGADAHDFLPMLVGSSIKLVLVERAVSLPGFAGNILRVDDSLRALARMGRFLVEKFRPKVVAITGSYGKTTAKEVIAHVLEGGLRVLRTPGSHNNEIGLPLTLLDLDGSQEVAVLEFSARREGDITYLGEIAPPDIAVLLTVGRAHIGVFGSQEAIYRAKGEIFSNLRKGGLALVGADDPRLRELAGQNRALSFGLSGGDYTAEDIMTDALGRQSFTGLHGETRLALQSAISGPHGAFPVLAAWAVARELGVADQVVAERAATVPAQKGRALTRKAPGGAIIVDDSYNASPETVINLMATLATMEASRRILVLGHLSELEEGLGDSSRIIGGALKPPLDGCHVLAPATPGFAEALADAAQDVRVTGYKNRAELMEVLRSLDTSGTVIGIKGARSAHTERIVQELLGNRVTCRLETCGILKQCMDCDRIDRDESP